MDTKTNRLYRGAYTGNRIGFGEPRRQRRGYLATGAATVAGPSGVVVDQAASKKLHWANGSSNKISWAKLDGSGGGDFNIGTATVSNPDRRRGLDTAAKTIYWANYGGDKISFARRQWRRWRPQHHRHRP